MAPPFDLTGRCAVCGFDPSTVAASDAVVAARSFPRRYREAFDAFMDDPEALNDRPTPEQLAPIEHAAAAAAEMRAAAVGVRAIATHDGATVNLDVEAVKGRPDEILEALAQAARDLAGAIDAVHGQEWERTGLVEGNTVKALDVARFGVHSGSHHLRLAKGPLEAR
jgi:hypothetical protein